MAEIIVAAVLGLSVGTNIFLGVMFNTLLKRYLQLSIAAAPVPVMEKAVLLDKTADQVAETALDRQPKGPVRPMGL